MSENIGIYLINLDLSNNEERFREGILKYGYSDILNVNLSESSLNFLLSETMYFEDFIKNLSEDSLGIPGYLLDDEEYHLYLKLSLDKNLWNHYYNLLLDERASVGREDFMKLIDGGKVSIIERIEDRNIPVEKLRPIDIERIRERKNIPWEFI